MTAKPTTTTTETIRQTETNVTAKRRTTKPNEKFWRDRTDRTSENFEPERDDLDLTSDTDREYDTMNTTCERERT